MHILKYFLILGFYFKYFLNFILLFLCVIIFLSFIAGNTSISFSVTLSYSISSLYLHLFDSVILSTIVAIKTPKQSISKWLSIDPALGVF